VPGCLCPGRYEMLVEERIGTTAPINLAVVHARAPEAREEMLSRARYRERLNRRRTYLHNICATLVVHFGSGTIGFCLYEVRSSS
jgi:fatty acid-binding protein DegV